MSNEAKQSPSMSGVTSGYTVEARWNYPSPKAFGQIILDREWRTIPFAEGQHGVPQKTNHWDGSFFLRQFGLYTFPVAEALRWWFIAEANSDSIGSLCLETRIVEHRVRYSSTADRAEPLSYSPPEAAPIPTVEGSKP